MNLAFTPNDIWLCSSSNQNILEIKIESISYHTQKSGNNKLILSA